MLNPLSEDSEEQNEGGSATDGEERPAKRQRRRGVVSKEKKKLFMGTLKRLTSDQHFYLAWEKAVIEAHCRAKDHEEESSHGSSEHSDSEGEDCSETLADEEAGKCAGSMIVKV